MERKYTQATNLSWIEVDQMIAGLASIIMAKRYIAFVTAADLESNIAAHMLANKLMAKYMPESIGATVNNEHAIVFKLDNHGLQQTEGVACLYRFTYEDPVYNTLMTPEFAIEEIPVEMDTRPRKIMYPWSLQ